MAGKHIPLDFSMNEREINTQTRKTACPDSVTDVTYVVTYAKAHMDALS